MLKQKIKRMLLCFRNRNKNVYIDRKAIVGYSSTFEGYNKLLKDVRFAGHMGRCSYLGEGTVMNAVVGRYCSIGNYVRVTHGVHPTKDWVSTNPVFFSTAKQCGISYVNEIKFDESNFADKDKRCDAVIGNDVWIGDRALIMAGVHIGDGAVIAAGAIVTKDVEPYAIVAGVPAKTIRYRFEPEEIKELLDFKWWDKPEKWIAEHSEEFENVKDFLKNNK